MFDPAPGQHLLEQGFVQFEAVNLDAFERFLKAEELGD